MNRSTDAWYVRFPDNRVVRANSTKSVRHNIKKGQIPPNSEARQLPFEHWTPLHRIDAFADLVTHNGNEQPGPDGQPMNKDKDSSGELQLHPMGVRGLAMELMSALESSLTKAKIKTAAVAALFTGLIFQLHEIFRAELEFPVSLAFAAGLGVVLLVIAAISIVLLTQSTFIELSQLRPAKPGEARQRLGRHAVHLTLGFLIVIGTIAGLLLAAALLPAQLAVVPDAPTAHPGFVIMISLLVVGQILLQVILLPLLGFSLLLGPLVVIEECSFVQAVRQWFGLVSRHLPRLFLYEALAASLVLALMLPLLVPIAFAAWHAPLTGPYALVARAALAVLFGLALTPAIVFLPVANVHIFLNLRYEHFAPK